MRTKSEEEPTRIYAETDDGEHADISEAWYGLMRALSGAVHTLSPHSRVSFERFFSQHLKDELEKIPHEKWLHLMMLAAPFLDSSDSSEQVN